MSTANLDSADLKAVKSGGLIREDAMNKIFDISRIPLPFTDMIGDETAKNAYVEWTQDTLANPNLSNAVVDGSDASGNDTAVGRRVGNQHQISVKVVQVSYRADASNTIGRAKELAYQVMRRQQELRRDVEAIALSNQASVADDGNTTAGKVGGLPAWMVTNTSNGASPGANGGFDSANNGGKLVTARTAGVARALSEDTLRDIIESVYNQGGDPTVMMTTPKLIRRFSKYMLTSGSHVATIMADQGQSKKPATALGAVNVFVTDFGTIKAVPNRLQQTYASSDAATCADVFILDPAYLSMCYLKGYQTDVLAKTGLSEKRLMSVDWTLIVHTEKAHGRISDVNVASAMVA